MSTTQVTEDGPICTHGEISVNPLNNLISLAFYVDAINGGIAANAALLQHFDQVRITAALENIAEMLHLIAEKKP